MLVLGRLPGRPLPIGGEGWHELDTMFVESQRMTEVHNGIVRPGEWRRSLKQSSRFNGVPGRRRYEMGSR